MKRLFALEVYEGRNTARADEQLMTYLDVIQQEAIERQFSFEHAVQVLAVFDTEAGERLTRDRLATRPAFAALRGAIFLQNSRSAAGRFSQRGWRRVGTKASVPLF